MVFRFLRVPAMAASVVLCSVSAFADEIPQLDQSRPHAMPGYPDALRHAGKTGTTVVAVHVNEIGKPYEVVTATSSGTPALDKAAVEAVRRWHFIPAEKDGVDAAEWTAVGFTFSADGVAQIPVPPDTEVARQDREHVVCKAQPSTTGSNLGNKPICMARWQWDEQARKKKDPHWRLPMMPDAGAVGSGK